MRMMIGLVAGLSFLVGAGGPAAAQRAAKGTARKPVVAKRAPSASRNGAVVSATLSAAAPFARVSVRFSDDPQACGTLGCEIRFIGTDQSGSEKDITQEDVLKNGMIGPRSEVIGEPDGTGLPRIVLEQGNIDRGATRNLFQYDPDLGRYALVGSLPSEGAWQWLLTARSAEILPRDPTRAPVPKPVALESLPRPNLCTSKSKDGSCEFVLIPVSTPRDACTFRDKVLIYACWDGPVRVGEALGLTEVYAMMFDDGEPRFDRAIIPLDRFYRSARLRRDKRGNWKEAGMALGGLMSCPDYGLSSLHQRQVIAGGATVRLVQFRRCDLPNDGRYTYQDRRLAQQAPFIRPGASVAAASPAAQPAPRQADVASVWALGRARYLVERGGRCGTDESLGKPFCFGEAIGWLRRHPDTREIDVVAFDESWRPGSFIPHAGGQGWTIYRVSRAGEAFRADKQLHYATRITLPPRCMFGGSGQRAWYVSVVDGRKAAVEAGEYRCNGWTGDPIFAGAADLSVFDGGRLEWTGLATEYRDRQGPVTPAGSGECPRHLYGFSCMGPATRPADAPSTFLHGSPRPASSRPSPARRKR